jgi:hypothetical protein
VIKAALMHILKTKWFAHWAAKEGLSSKALCEAVDEMNQGLVDANLGGNVVKKRVAVGGRGKSGGVRTLLAFKQGDRAFFLYGFAKNQQSNISEKELKALKLLAAKMLAYDGREITMALAAHELYEVKEDDDEA